MKEKLNIKELVGMIIEKSGVSRKSAEALIKAIPEVIEEGLLADGEVKVKGLGTFRLKWVNLRPGRNLKTGEKVDIPPHSKVVLIPEKKMLDKVNRDFRFLSYRILTEAEEKEKEKPAPFEPVKTDYETGRMEPALQAAEAPVEPAAIQEPEPEIPPVKLETATPPASGKTPRKRYAWIIPAVFLLIIILIILFYLRNCQHRFLFEKKDKGTPEQVIKPVESPVIQPLPVVVDTVKIDTVKIVPGQSKPVVQKTAEEQLPVKSTPERQVVLVQGDYLFRLASESYGDPYLWVLIYKENKDKISDPEQVLSGDAMLIPSLEGSSQRLSRKDSADISEGYHLLYEYYKAKDDSRTDDYRRAMLRYKPH